MYRPVMLKRVNKPPSRLSVQNGSFVVGQTLNVLKWSIVIDKVGEKTNHLERYEGVDKNNNRYRILSETKIPRKEFSFLASTRDFYHNLRTNPIISTCFLKRTSFVSTLTHDVVVFPVCPGATLENILSNTESKLHHSDASWLAEEMLKIVVYIHNLKYAHGAISLTSFVFLEREHRLILSDFGRLRPTTGNERPRLALPSHDTNLFTAPRSAHLHMDFGLKDDIESWLFCSFALFNVLPWSPHTELKQMFEIKQKMIQGRIDMSGAPTALASLLPSINVLKWNYLPNYNLFKDAVQRLRMEFGPPSFCFVIDGAEKAVSAQNSERNSVNRSLENVQNTVVGSNRTLENDKDQQIRELQEQLKEALAKNDRISTVAAMDVTNDRISTVAAMDVTNDRISTVAAMDVTNDRISTVAAMDVTNDRISTVAAMDVTNDRISTVAAMDVTNDRISTVAAMDVTNDRISTVAAMDVTNDRISTVAAMDVTNDRISTVAAVDVTNDRISTVAAMDVTNDRISTVAAMDFTNHRISTVAAMDVTNDRISTVAAMDVTNDRISTVAAMDVTNDRISTVAAMDVTNDRTSTVAAMDVTNDGISTVAAMDVTNDRISTVAAMDATNDRIPKVATMSTTFPVTDGYHGIVPQLMQKPGRINHDACLDATNRFYTLIPHNFGMKAPPLLDDTKTLQEKSGMLDSLLEIEFAYGVLKEEVQSKVNKNRYPVDVHYEKLKTKMEAENGDEIKDQNECDCDSDISIFHKSCRIRPTLLTSWEFDEPINRDSRPTRQPNVVVPTTRHAPFNETQNGYFGKMVLKYRYVNDNVNWVKVKQKFEKKFQNLPTFTAKQLRGRLETLKSILRNGKGPNLMKKLSALIEQNGRNMDKMDEPSSTTTDESTSNSTSRNTPELMNRKIDNGKMEKQRRHKEEENNDNASHIEESTTSDSGQTGTNETIDKQSKGGKMNGERRCRGETKKEMVNYIEEPSNSIGQQFAEE